MTMAYKEDSAQEEQYYSALEAVIKFIKANGNEEELLEWVEDYSKLNPNKLNRECVLDIINISYAL